MPQSFASLVLKCLTSLQSRNITPKALTNTVLCQKLFDSESEESLVVDCKNDIQQASSNAAIFELVKPYMSFLNPELLAHIIEYLGSEKNCIDFKDYMNALEEYYNNETQIVLPCQPDEMPESKVAFQNINVIIETAIMNPKSVRNIKSKMAKILKLDVAALQIKSAGGSPLAILFQIPSFACERAFPLSSEQESELKDLGALSLKCREYSFCQNLPTQCDEVSDEDDIEMPCLGRPFRVGMLYDCRNDNLLGIHLCNDDVIETLLEEQSQVSQSYEVLEDDCLETKALSLQLTTPLKLSLLSNLVHDNSKSAKYWNDRCKSKHQVRVCLKYTSTTNKKQLPLNNLGEFQQHTFGHATHVVTGVLYGLDAYCVFDHMLRENERFEDIHENIVTMVKALSSSEGTYISTQAASNCKVYSDMEYPCNLQKVADFFRELPSLSANEKPTPVPKKVWLHPLKMLDNKCNVVVQHVSTNLVNQVQSLLEYLHDVVILSSDLLSKHSVTFSRFQRTESRVKKFTEIVTTYRNDLRKNIAKVLPHVREGTVEESEMATIIQENSTSPFKIESLTTWLEQVMEEISVLDMLMHHVNHVHFISSQELHSIIEHELESDYLVCFSFDVTLEDDQVINLLQSYLQTGEVDQRYGELFKSSQPLKWYSNTELMKKITFNIEHFKTFMENNSENKATRFVVTSYASNTGVTLNEPSSASILLYEGTTCKVWEPPGSPGKPTVKEVTHDTVQLEWSKPEYGSQSVECYQVTYHPVDNPQGGSILTTITAQEMATIRGLTSGIKYVFTIQSKCKVGVGSRGDTSAPVETKVATPVLVCSKIDKKTSSTKATHESFKSGYHLSSPNRFPTSDNITTSPVVLGKPKATAVTHNSITLQWAMSDHSSDDVELYIVSYCPADDSSKKWKKITNGAEQSILVSGLLPQTKYVFKVQPVLDDGVGDESDVSDPIETKAPACQPGRPTASAVSHDSITLQWEKPEHGYENVESYLIRYRCIDGPTKKWKIVMTASTEGKLNITKLTPQTTYIFKVRPMLEDGVGTESEVSDPIETKAPIKKASSAGLGKPTATSINHDSITLEWTKPERSSEDVECYTVSYRSVDDANKKWKRLTTKTAQESTTVTGLKVDSKYVFKVRSECGSDVGSSSELSDPILTRATSSPGKPTVSSVTHNSIQLNWRKPELDSEKVKQYRVLYYLRSDDECTETQKELLTENNQDCMLVGSLSTNRMYTFQVCPVCPVNVGSMSEISDPITTKPASPPGKPTYIAITHNSVTLTWNKPKSGSENVECYTVLVECEDTVVKELKTQGSNESFVVQHLDMKREYQFKIRPECGESGVGMMSETSQLIETMATSPPGKPIVFEVSHDSIQLQWTKPEEQCVTIEGYEVWYKKVQEEVQWRKKIFSEPELKSDIITKHIDFDSEYVFKIVPFCNTGKGSESEVSDPVRTKSTSPPGKPIASTATHTTVQLEWTKPECGSENIEYYNVFICSEELVNVVKKASNEEKVKSIFGGLYISPDTEYVFKIQPHCPSGPGAESELSNIIRTKCANYKPGKPRAETTAYDKVSLKWKRPEHKWYKVEDYSVYYRTVNDSCWNKSTNPVTTKQGYMYGSTVNSLLSATEYIFKVQSHTNGSVDELNADKESEPSDPIQTKATTPPSKPIAIARSFNSVHLKWTVPERGSENIDHYIIKYQEKHGQPVETNAVRDSHAVVQTLRSKTRYTFTVIPHCRVGKGEPSESSLIETAPVCRPGKASCVASTHDSIILTWKKPDYSARYVDYYILSCIDIKREVSPRKHEKFTVDGLTHNTEYIFKILPVCKRSSTTVDTDCSISDPIATKATSPPGKPIKSSTCTTHDSISLQWVKPAIGSERIKCYQVNYQEKSKCLLLHGAKHFIRTDNIQETATVKNLQCGTKYIFRVQAVCECDIEGKDVLGMDSEPSVPIETNTTSPPGKPKASEITHNSITLVWDKPKHGSSDIQRYTVYFSTNGNKWEDVPETFEQKKHGSSISCTALNLNLRTFYLFRIYSVCMSGTGSYSEVSSRIETKATAPSGKPKACKETHDSIQVEWECPNYGQERIDHYQLSYTKLEHDMETAWATIVQIEKTEYCVGNLEMKSQYVFKVFPICKQDQGEGTESERSDPIMTKATSPPGKPVATKVTHNSVHLEWTKPAIGVPKRYTIYFCVATMQARTWTTWPGTSQERIEINKIIKPDTSYLFHIRPVCADCDGTDSEISDVITTRPECRPGKPIVSEISHDSIKLTWTKPKHGSDMINLYTVQFKVSTDPKWKQQRTQGDQNEITIIQLSDSTSYTFRVCAEPITNYEDTNIGIEFSEEEHVTTQPLPLAVRVYRKSQSEKLVISQGPPAVYGIPGMTPTMRDEANKIAKCHFGDPSLAKGKPERILMLVGATGAGKSTLIEFMVNYIFGVKWKDKFRFQLIKQEARSQAESQTSFITAYTFYPGEGLSFNYTLTIIDTPGYGDTRGIKYDVALTEQIKEFFSTPSPHGIDHIDGVGFVTRAGSSRLTPTQQYIFDSIMGIFGEDMKDNIFLMITFCDAQKPKVLEAIRVANIPNVGHFLFNNSAVYADNSDTTDIISKGFWKMGLNTLCSFLIDFENMDSRSLQLTKDTLKERERLEILVEGLQRQITTSLDLIREIQQDKEAIKAHQLSVDSEVPFMYEVEVIKSFEEALSNERKKVTICLNCNFTCHYPCTISNDEKKYNCAAMKGKYFERNKDSCCTVCPGKCHWTRHVNRPFQYVRRPVKEKRTLDDLIKRYISTAGGQQSTAENMLSALGQRLKETYDEVLELIYQTQESINQLDKIALRKSDSSREHSSQVAYIDLLISAEQRGEKPGFVQRIESLKLVRDKAQVAVEIAKSVVYGQTE